MYYVPIAPISHGPHCSERILDVLSPFNTCVRCAPHFHSLLLTFIVRISVKVVPRTDLMHSLAVLCVVV